MSVEVSYSAPAVPQALPDLVPGNEVPHLPHERVKIHADSFSAKARSKTPFKPIGIFSHKGEHRRHAGPPFLLYGTFMQECQTHSPRCDDPARGSASHNTPFEAGVSAEQGILLPADHILKDLQASHRSIQIFYEIESRFSSPAGFFLF
jgi:hypothetical protein